MSRSLHNSKIIKGMTWEVIAKFVIQLASWTSTVIVARILSPADYGLVATSGVFVGLLTLIADMGLAQGLINKAEVTKEEYNIVFWVSLAISTIFFCILYILAPVISLYYKEEILINVIRLSAFMLIFSSLKLIPTVVLLREMDFRYTAFVQMLSQATVIIVVIILASAGYGVWSLIYSVLAGQIMQVVLYIPKMQILGKLNLSIVKVVDTLSFGAKLMLSRVLAYFTNRSGVFILGVELGQQKLGYFDMSNTLALMPLEKIGSIFNRVTFPAVSRIKDDKEHAAIIFITMHKYLLMVSVPIFALLIVAAEDVVRLLFTEKWLPIVPVLQGLAIINIFRLSGMLMPGLLEGLGKPGEVLIYQFISAICMPTAILLGVSSGLMGAVYAMMVAYPMLYLYILSRVLFSLNIKIGELIRSVYPVIIGSVLMAGVIFTLKTTLDKSAANMLIVAIFSTFVYLAVLLAADRNLFKEIKYGISTLNGKNGK